MTVAGALPPPHATVGPVPNHSYDARGGHPGAVNKIQAAEEDPHDNHRLVHRFSPLHAEAEGAALPPVFRCNTQLACQEDAGVRRSVIGAKGAKERTATPRTRQKRAENAVSSRSKGLYTTGPTRCSAARCATRPCAGLRTNALGQAARAAPVAPLWHSNRVRGERHPSAGASR